MVDVIGTGTGWAIILGPVFYVYPHAQSSMSAQCRVKKLTTTQKVVLQFSYIFLWSPLKMIDIPQDDHAAADNDPPDEEEEEEEYLVTIMQRLWAERWGEIVARRSKDSEDELEPKAAVGDGDVGKGQMGETCEIPHTPTPYVWGTMAIATRLDAPMLYSKTHVKIQS